MTKMLASVNSLQEAQIVQQTDVDIIDLKQPTLGALGALDTAQVKKIVTALAQSHAVSATVGDLPMQADLIISAVQNMANTGVDFVKIGFFPDQDWHDVIKNLQSLIQQSLAQKPLRLIAVLFADQQPDLETVELFSQAGFEGVMLDTMDKSRGSLTQVMPLAVIQDFVKSSKQHHLLCGLAGSLRATDVPALRLLGADYLGFRGALCAAHQRTAALDPVATRAILTTLKH
ncbi:MAG: hypothetical protein DRQ62_15280 [Gammaproteobacteria bacterium]|nr:MAG: hypothetical protein DRQ62_15280 [Gammaproteobacteria bacterium]